MKKNYAFFVINKNIQNVKNETNRVVLNAVDENALIFKAMHNADVNFHQFNKNFRMIEAHEI